MSTLYIRPPSKAAADSATHWLALACPFALVSHGSTIERQGTAPLSDLSDTIAKSQRVVLLLAASDVTLLRVQVPPMSAAKLKAALPNMVEEQLLCDPSECVVAAGGSLEGLRTVAVARREWLNILSKTLIAYGASHISALPAQLCLAHESSGQPGSVTAAIGEQNTCIDLTLRLTELDGFGLAVNAIQNETAVREVIDALLAVVPVAAITLLVPQTSVSDYQNEINASVTLNKRFSVVADNWSSWIAGANGTTLDLMAGLGAGNGPALDWRPWRWPLALAAMILAVNIIALNIDWWRMKGESNTLRTTMIQIYKSAYPKESVIIDPIAQMRQKIAIAKHDSGLAAPDDFTALASAFGEAWSNAVVAAGKTTAIAALEYRERSLFVRFKGEAPTQQMKDALSNRNLSLSVLPEQSGAIVWKIGSAK